MRFEEFSFGAIRIDGATYEHDVVIDRGEISKRQKKASKKFRDEFGHTPLSIEEKIPWKCRRLVVGTGAYGRLPVMDEVRREARRRRVELLALPTIEAIEALKDKPEDTNAVLHVTC
ncbi:MAG TPA: MTH938/NDUFAF3 family protein [Blastocatellia bacterium]|nr:MTH938/NDUFAF3 family protein [Blastocatellia bacterium]